MVWGGYLFKMALVREPHLSSLTGSLFRVVLNLMLVVGVVACMRGSSRTIWQRFRGAKPRGLMVWGLLGSLTIIFYFITLEHLGVGQSSFLINTNGAMMVVLSPLLLRERLHKWLFVNACFAILGSYLIMFADVSGMRAGDLTFLCTGLLSGLTAALAYIWIGRHHVQESTWTIMFYWSAMAVAIHLGLAYMEPIAMPENSYTWILLLGSGVAACLGQYGVTASFQAPDNLVYAVLAYVGATFALGLDAVLGEVETSLVQLGGAMMIILSSVLSVRSSRRSMLVQEIPVVAKS